MILSAAEYANFAKRLYGKAHDRKCERFTGNTDKCGCLVRLSREAAAEFEVIAAALEAGEQHIIRSDRGDKDDPAIVRADHYRTCVLKLAQAEEQCNRLTGMKFSDRMHAALVDRAEKAEQERDALRADAERYRWLRQKSSRQAMTGRKWAGQIQVLQWEDRTEANVLTYDSLDSAVDAALAETRG